MKKKYTFMGAKSLGNYCGIGVIKLVYDYNGIVDNDFIVSGFDFGNGVTNISRSKIKYNNNGDPYFMRYGVKYFLSDFIRI